ncbi:MAG: hypothetical protein Ct9H300mP31_15340 [Acidimicrobiaceae bacterium]|nr:MAG: hypothetical protein Ct9H300mP31_15340 [Acidimicrobiaceae bacterium]
MCRWDRARSPPGRSLPTFFTAAWSSPAGPPRETLRTTVAGLGPPRVSAATTPRAPGARPPWKPHGPGGRRATVADYERCAMLRFRNPHAATGHHDDLGDVEAEIDLAARATGPRRLGRRPLAGPPCRVGTSGPTNRRPTDTGTDAIALGPSHPQPGTSTSRPGLGPGGPTPRLRGHTIGLAQGPTARMFPDTATVLVGRLVTTCAGF